MRTAEMPLATVDSLEKSPEEAEVIVVGSGFGGAVAACRLAQAGIDVCVIERGRRYEAGDFPELPTEHALLPDLARWSWQHGQGLWDVVDLEEVVSVQAAGYGGGSLIYANVHLRPPGSVFDERWPDAYRNGQLEEFYDLASFMLDVAPIDAHPDLAGKLVKPDQMKKVAGHIGRADAFFHPPLALSSREGLNVHGRSQKKCTGCGSCCTGCPETAKNSLDLNYLSVAEDNGARVVTQCEVVKIAQLPGGAWRLTCFDHLAGSERLFKAGSLFLCAGAVHSTRLLASAELCIAGRRAQSLAGIGYYVNTDALGVVYETVNSQYPSYGPAITTSLVCPDPSGSSASFFLIQEGGYPRELERLMGVLRGRAWLGRNRFTRAAADAKVDPSTRCPPRQPALVAAEPSPFLLPLVSPLDDLLDAVASGAFRSVASDEMRAHWSALLGEIEGLLPLPGLVDRTIDLTLYRRFQRRWLTAWMTPDRWLARGFVRVIRFLLRLAVGSSEALAHSAFRALSTGANLKRADVARHVLGYAREQVANRVVLLAMGHDAKPGNLVYDVKQDRLLADLDLYHLFPRYTNEEQVMAEIGQALGGELRTNPAWAFLGKPITVHGHGGCPMSDSPRLGVTNPDGEVHGCEGLYILDGSILCTSVGVNPSATILAIAERNIREFIRRYKANPTWPDNDAGAGEYRRHLKGAKEWRARADVAGWVLHPPLDAEPKPFDPPLGLGFSEAMQGSYAPTDRRPEMDADYRRLETVGRPDFPIALELDVSVENLARLFVDCRHEMEVSGDVTIRLPGEPAPGRYPIKGRLELFVERRKPYGIRAHETERRAAQENLLRSRYTTVVAEAAGDERRQMVYELDFSDGHGGRWAIRGHKNIRDDPGLDAWRDTSSMFVLLRGPVEQDRTHSNGAAEPVVRGAGVVHVDLDGFLHHQLPSLRITPAGVDPARAMWARLKFAAFFFGTLQRIYLPELSSVLEAFFKVSLSGSGGNKGYSASVSQSSGRAAGRGTRPCGT